MKKQKAKKAENGAGTLFKKLNGRRYKSGARIHAPFYLTTTATVEGKRKTHTQRLLTEGGELVYDRKEAEAIRERLTRPNRAESELAKTKEIETLLRDKTADLEQAQFDAVNRLRLVDAWEVYVDSPTRKQCSETTLKNCYAPVWRRFMGWLSDRHSEIKYLNQISDEQATEYVRGLKGEVSGKSYNNHVTFLKAFFRVMNKPGKLAGVNPFIEIENIDKGTKSRREFTIEELRAMITAAADESQEYYLLFLVGTFSGLRLYDCATLLWQEVDLDRRLIIRVPHKTAKSGKAVKIGMPAFLVNELRPHKRLNGFVCPGIAEHYTTGKHSKVSRTIKRIFRRAGIVKQFDKGTDGRARAAADVGFHSLRHTFVSLQAEAGTSLAAVQALVGHANPAMTRHYHHTTNEAALQAADSFPLRLGDAVQDEQREPLPAWAVRLVREATDLEALKAELLRV